MRHTALRLGITAAILGAALLAPRDGRAQQPTAPPQLGIVVPNAARAVLSQAELVEAVCLTTRWRTEELFAAIDGTAARQPSVQAALDKAGVRFVLPNPEEFRKRATDQIGAICAAPTVDQAVALTSGLLQINTDMESKYGALSEALGGPIQQSVQGIEDRIRADIDQLVEPRRVKIEADLRAEGQAIADRHRAVVEASLRTEINAYATNLAKSYKPEQQGEFQAALQPYIDRRVEEAKAEVTRLVEAELASRIEAAKAQIQADAELFRAERTALSEGNLRDIGAQFEAMLKEVDQRVAAARTANSPAKQAAVEIRVRLAMKTTDAYLTEAKATITLARAELASLKAANPSVLDADQLLARLDASRTKLEADLRAAANAGSETDFTAAYTGFEAAWREVAANVDAAAGTWTPARVCQEAGSALATAKTEAEAARSEIQGAQGGVVAAGSDAADQERIQALKDGLTKSASTLDTFITALGKAQAACQSPSGDPRALIALLDEARLTQGAARQAYESARTLAQSFAR